MLMRHKTIISLVVIFILGLSVSILFWPYVSISYKDEFGIISALSLLNVSPLTNSLRFVIFIATPLILIFFYWLIFRPEPESKILPARQKKNQKMKGLFIFFMAVFTIVLALNVRTYHAMGSFDTFHEGESLGAAESYSHSQIPYQDYVIYHGLLQDPLKVLVSFKLFHKSISSARTMESILKLITYMLFLAFVLIIFRADFLASCITMLVLASFHFLRVIGFRGYDMAILNREIPLIIWLISLFISYILIDKVASKKIFILLGFVTGFSVPLSLSYSVDRGIYVMIAYPLALTALMLIAKRKQKLWIVLGNVAGLISGFIILLLLLKGAVGSFIKFILIDVSRYVEPMFGLPYSIKEPIHLAALIIITFNFSWLFWHFLQVSKSGLLAKVQQFIHLYFIEFTLLIVSLVVFRGGIR